MTATNLLAINTAKMLTGIGGWSPVTNCTLSHSVHGSPWTVVLGGDVYQNGMQAKATGAGNIEYETEDFRVNVGSVYKSTIWLGMITGRTSRLGIRFYDIDSILLLNDYNEIATFEDNEWGGIGFAEIAPENAYYARLYSRSDGLAIDEVIGVSRPAVFEDSDIYSDFMSYTLKYVPQFMIDDDFAQDKTGNPGVPSPLVRYMSMGTYPLSLIHDTIQAWDYVRPVDSIDGQADLSTLADPFAAESAWLPWLAQTMGVSLDTIPSGGRSPWLAFETAGIDTWVEWEEDVDPLSIPGVSDTEWVDIETFSPDFFNVDVARRLQIASGFNGILGGTAESISIYVSALLNTESDNPFVYVVKHYATNPYRVLVATLGIEDPDPDGDMLERAIEAATPAGTDVTTKHGVYVTARSYYATDDFFSNMWTDLPFAASRLPIRMVENGAASGQSLVTASVTGSLEPFYGSGVGLARWYEGYSLYSGAVQLRTEPHSSFNVLGDMSFRVLVSNVSLPATGNTLLIGGSEDKWNLQVDDAGTLIFNWENSGSNQISSDTVVNFGNADTRPFWLRVDLDVNNGASGHDVYFYTSPSLYSEVWDQVGTTITTGAVTAIDTSANANLYLLDDTTTSDASLTTIVYRAILYDDLTGSIANDINLTGEFTHSADLINTNTRFFRLPISNIQVFVEPATVGATNLVESDWVANNHAFRDDYWYFGHSPFSFSGGTASLGDTLVVTDLPSDTYDWTVTLADGTTDAGSTGTVTSITFDADDHGGQSILNIAVREDTGQTLQAFFTPDMLSGNTLVAVDGQSRTWTLTRAFETSEYYEFSEFVDRPHLQASGGDGVFTSGQYFDAEEPITVGIVARRFWSTAGITDIVDHTFTGTATTGWKIRYNGTDIEAIVEGDPGNVTLSYNESATALGEFNLITLRRDIQSGLISLWINETKEDEIADPWLDAGLFDPADIGNTGTFGDSSAVNKFDMRYFGIFDRSLSDDDILYLTNEMGRLVPLLPQAQQTINAPIVVSAPVVYIPGFDLADWDILPGVITAGPTLHAPQLNMSVPMNFLATTVTLYAPQINKIVQADFLATTVTLYQPTVDQP